MVSPIVRDVLETFRHAYTNDANFIASCMLANSGVYNLVYRMSDFETYDHHKCAFARIHDAYIWKDLGIVSDVLKQSFLYDTTERASPMICIMDDRSLSQQMRAFKASIVDLFQRNSTFLSYCDMEGSELFTFCSPNQAMASDVYVKQSQQVGHDIERIVKRFSKVVPDCVMQILGSLRFWVSVRNQTSCFMVESPDIYKTFPCSPRYNEETFHVALADLVYCKIDVLPSTIAKLYKHAVPFYVLNELQWLVTMQGERQEEHPPLKVFYNEDAMNGLITLKAFVEDERDNLMPIMRNLFTTPFWRQAFDTLQDTHIFDSYTPAFVGGVALDVFKQIQELYSKNHKIMVLADVLGCGIFNALSTSHQLRPFVLEPVISKCVATMKTVHAHFVRHNELLIVIDQAMKPLADALKRVQRYWAYCCKLYDTEDTPNYLDLIFGDVFDGDGAPTTCAICLDTSQEKKDTWFALPCKHVFHIECLNHMSYFSDRCPCCRCEI